MKYINKLTKEIIDNEKYGKLLFAESYKQGKSVWELPEWEQVEE